MPPKESEDYIFLSYPWGPSCPPYANGDPITFKGTKQISRGDSCNSLWISAPNHIGTHMDFPLHFCADGKSALDYSADEFVFQSPMVIDFGGFPKGTLVTPHHVDRALDRCESTQNFSDSDLILLKTNASTYRNTRDYWENGPGLGLGLAAHFRKLFPRHRAVGIDAISITTFGQREIGRQVHREFLGDRDPVVLIEDMDLTRLENFEPATITALPLRIELGDGAPATVIASRKPAPR